MGAVGCALCSAVPPTQRLIFLLVLLSWFCCLASWWLPAAMSASCLLRCRAVKLCNPSGKNHPEYPLMHPSITMFDVGFNVVPSAAGVVFEGPLSYSQRQQLSKEYVGGLLGCSIGSGSAGSGSAGSGSARSAGCGSHAHGSSVRVLRRHDAGTYVHVFSHIRCVRAAQHAAWGGLLFHSGCCTGCCVRMLT